MKKDLIANADRGWKGISHASSLKQSPLLEKVDKNMWITTSYAEMRAHMRYVAFRMNPLWRFYVYTDVDLMTAWLGSTALKRQNIFDSDVAMNGASVSLTMHSLVDLVTPPELLVIHLGVKASRNSATPEVLLEAIQIRVAQGKPVWVFDQPNQPFNYTHIAYSEHAESILQEFDREILKSKVRPSTMFGNSAKSSSSTPTSPAISSSAAPSGGLSSIRPSEETVESQQPVERPAGPPRPSTGQDDGPIFKVRPPKKKSKPTFR